VLFDISKTSLAIVCALTCAPSTLARLAVPHTAVFHLECSRLTQMLWFRRKCPCPQGWVARKDLITGNAHVTKTGTPVATCSDGCRQARKSDHTNQVHRREGWRHVSLKVHFLGVCCLSLQKSIHLQLDRYTASATAR
jgi:hypothetical protein